MTTFIQRWDLNAGLYWEAAILCCQQIIFSIGTNNDWHQWYRYLCEWYLVSDVGGYPSQIPLNSAKYHWMASTWLGGIADREAPSSQNMSEFTKILQPVEVWNLFLLVLRNDSHFEMSKGPNQIYPMMCQFRDQLNSRYRNFGMMIDDGADWLSSSDVESFK